MLEVVAVTEAPENTRNLIRQRARWQRVINETLWRYRRMILNPRYGTVGLVGLPYYVFYEGLVPFVELVALVLEVAVVWRKQVELEVLRRSMSNSLPIDSDPDGDIPGLDEVFDGEAVDFVTHAVPSLAPSDDLL